MSWVSREAALKEQEAEQQAKDAAEREAQARLEREMAEKKAAAAKAARQAAVNEMQATEKLRELQAKEKGEGSADDRIKKGIVEVDPLQELLEKVTEINGN